MYTDQEFIALLKSEVKPALGCTEPMAVSLCVARCCEALRSVGTEPQNITVEVSRNILKNAMGVGIPGTQMVGLQAAVAVALVCGRSEYGLEVLRDVCEGSVERAKDVIAQNIVTIKLAECEKMLFIRAICSGGGHSAQVVIEDIHDNITLVSLDSTVLFNKEASTLEAEQSTTSSAINPSISEIFEFATTVELSKIDFMADAVKLNRAIAMEGLSRDYGLQVGRKIYSKMGGEVFGSGVLSYSMALTAAASDARMAGSTMTVMSNSGSGNQGITATLPVVAAAEKYNSTNEELLRALTLSHLVAIHIKQKLGRLSALCGCVVASTGSSCGIVLLKGGGLLEVGYAIKNMVGNITGMVCDGAKVGCALKVASGVSAALQSALLALEGISTSQTDGIIDDDIERTLQNLATIGCKGMQYTDALMLEIMTGKGSTL